MRSFFAVFGPFLGFLALAVIAGCFLVPLLYKALKAARVSYIRNSSYVISLEQYKEDTEDFIAELIVQLPYFNMPWELKEKLYKIKPVETKHYRGIETKK